MENVVVEHPHINPKYEGKRVRYIYMSIGSMEGISSPPMGYMRLDLLTGEKQEWFAPLHSYCEEVVVIPKDDNDDTEEKVYVLTTVYDSNKDRSSIHIFDGESIHSGPVARIWLNHHLPHSLHGCFVKNI